MATLRLKNGSTKIIKAGTLVRYNPADKKSFIATSLEDADVIGVLSTSTAPNGVGVIDLLGASTGTGTTATITKSAVEAVLTGEISSHTHAGSGLTQQQIMRLQ